MKRLLIVLLILTYPALKRGLAQPVQQPGSAPIQQEQAAPVTLADFHYVPADDDLNGNGPLQPLRDKAGLAMLGSAAVPGLGQAANRKWVRAGLYALVEAVSWTLYIKHFSDARSQEDRYHNFADNNWSVVKYAKWLVDYNNFHEGTNIQYNDLGQNLNGEPAYNTEKDWARVDIEKLRALERQTYYYDSQGRQYEHFSHEIPDYGSQQYYELMSKYYQFGAGWSDFPQSKVVLDWNTQAMSDNFHRGADLAERFNDNYRFAGNMLTLLIVNHFVSAFDALFTVQVMHNRLEAQTAMLYGGGGQLTLNYHF